MGSSNVPSNMTDRTSTGSKAKQNVGVTTETRTKVDAVEEKVVRMRHGFPVPDDLELEQKGQGHEDVRQQLLAIERMAFEKSGRLEELRREAGLDDDPEADPDTKKKIVAGLQQKMSK